MSKLEYLMSYYAVDTFGNVLSLRTWEVVNPFLSRNYEYVNLCVKGVRRKESVHRLVAISFLPNPENKYSVNHIDANGSNNVLSNLEWATQQEQINHSLKLGLQSFPTGANNPLYRHGAYCQGVEVTDEIREIRLRPKRKYKQKMKALKELRRQG